MSVLHHRLQLENLTDEQVQVLIQFFNGEEYTKHGVTRIYPALSHEETLKKIEEFNQTHKMDFHYSFIADDLSLWGFKRFEAGIDLNAPIEEADFYKLREEFDMGEYFEGIDDTHEKFIPAVIEALSFTLNDSCKVFQLKNRDGNEMIFTVEDEDHDLHVTYSNHAKTLLFQFGVEQNVSPKLDTGDSFNELSEFIEMELWEQFFAAA